MTVLNSKKLLCVVSVFLIVLSGNILAQNTTDKVSLQDMGTSLLVKWTGVELDSAETIWSQDFKITDYDGFNTASTNTNAVKPQVGYRATLASGKTTVMVNVYHYVNYIHPDSLNDWIVSDTLAVITGETPAKAEVDLNNVKAPFHKLEADVLNTGQKCLLNFGLYFPLKENND